MKNINIKKGISLIVLVITIIVIIILAVAVILSINNNNPIENARKAKNANDESAFKEASELYLGQYILDTKTGKIEPNIKTAQEYVKEELRAQGFPEEKIELIVINNNKIEIVTKEVADFIKEMDTSLIYSSGYLTGLLDMENSSMYTKETLLSKLPEGANILNYKGEEIDNTKVIGTGYQILDKNGNIIAYTVFWSDLDGNGRVNAIEYARIKRYLRIGDFNDAVKGDFGDWFNVAFLDANGDKIIDTNDYDYIMLSLRGGAVPPYIGYFNQFRPVDLDVKVILNPDI